MTRQVFDIPAATEERLMDLIIRQVDMARDRITTEASWAVLENFFLASLEGRNSLSALVIVEWARAGHPAADRAVRRYVATMWDQGRVDELLVQVQAYQIEANLRDRVPFPRGRHIVQHLMRDLWLPMLVQRVADGTGLAPTRSGGSAQPSAAYFVSKALRKRGFEVKEREVSRIYWRRGQLVARLEASMPPVSG
jgi:hypothetical protein